MNRQEGDKLTCKCICRNEKMVHSHMELLHMKKEVLQLMFQNGKSDKCIQCNQCSFVCPHAVIRPFLLTEEEVSKCSRRHLKLKKASR